MNESCIKRRRNGLKTTELQSQAMQKMPDAIRTDLKKKRLCMQLQLTAHNESSWQLLGSDSLNGER